MTPLEQTFQDIAAALQEALSLAERLSKASERLRDGQIEDAYTVLRMADLRSSTCRSYLKSARIGLLYVAGEQEIELKSGYDPIGGGGGTGRSDLPYGQG